jgi:hypothetical protein
VITDAGAVDECLVDAVLVAWRTADVVDRRSELAGQWYGRCARVSGGSTGSIHDATHASGVERAGSRS